MSIWTLGGNIIVLRFKERNYRGGSAPVGGGAWVRQHQNHFGWTILLFFHSTHCYGILRTSEAILSTNCHLSMFYVAFLIPAMSKFCSAPWAPPELLLSVHGFKIKLTSSTTPQNHSTAFYKLWTLKASSQKVSNKRKPTSDAPSQTRAECSLFPGPEQFVPTVRIHIDRPIPALRPLIEPLTQFLRRNLWLDAGLMEGIISWRYTNTGSSWTVGTDSWRQDCERVSANRQRLAGRGSDCCYKRHAGEPLMGYVLVLYPNISFTRLLSTIKVRLKSSCDDADKIVGQGTKTVWRIKIRLWGPESRKDVGYWRRKKWKPQPRARRREGFNCSVEF